MVQAWAMQKCKISDIKKLPNYSNGWKGSLRSQNENCPARYVLTPGLTFKKITIFPSVPPGRSQSQTHPEHTVRTRLISPSLNVWKNISKINTRTFSGSFIIPCCNITGIAVHPDSYSISRPPTNTAPSQTLGGHYWHVPGYVCFHSGPAVKEHDDAHHRCRDQQLSIETKPGKVETYLLPKVLPAVKNNST